MKQTLMAAALMLLSLNVSAADIRGIVTNSENAEPVTATGDIRGMLDGTAGQPPAVGFIPTGEQLDMPISLPAFGNDEEGDNAFFNETEGAQSCDPENPVNVIIVDGVCFR
jgi:hypothetical protein